ncbi:D-cysteine desulfhydrase family protein [Streptosporangium sp. G11]|uniref:D-cysteine desulfhydrase family protein n=1 Tax=Streptosporangium sp. G11 TaxID=3436926 RepID=UPI003EBF8BC7
MDDATRRGTRVRLGYWPTPIEPAPRLASALGLGRSDLWIKRDDLTGLGAGGNKIRKLEWTVGEAIARGADTLVTTGAPQSNHARLTAAAAARLGLRAVLVLGGTDDGSRQGNVLLDALFGARIHWAGDTSPDELVAQVAEEIRDGGGTPYVIPFGGSSALGAIGYVEAGHEIDGQLPAVRTVVCAVGSGGTMAGLVAALGADRVLGVDTGAMRDPRSAVARMASEASGVPVAEEQLRIRDDQLGDGYGLLSQTTAGAIHLAARTEGIVLDPTYTGRAMAGLVAAVKDGTIRPGETTVFLHSGGLPGLFGHPAARQRLGSE